MQISLIIFYEYIMYGILVLFAEKQFHASIKSLFGIEHMWARLGVVKEHDQNLTSAALSARISLFSASWELRQELNDFPNPEPVGFFLWAAA